ncbi:MAG: tRNA 2-thiouridine(34) synthase MnmA [Nocardiopsaceae bacterium]|nr:tRNA 2-thiouridine(34) synthase MnmA [Nocardiopsaceae bacterium]
MGMRVLAAMSGGVDSATAAARMVDAGHEVTGVHLALSRNPQSYRSGARGCCTLEDARDARRAADVIGIPFYVWDMGERFAADVVDDFVEQYAAGRTPNPCLRCNEKIKFAAVLDRALALGFDAVCTGHYARIDSSGALNRAADDGKDQSYVLAVLTREQISRALFPLGDTPKSKVREEAAERGLLVADKPDSHDVCFIADGDTRGFLAQKLGEAPGRIVDADGTVLGEHDGAYGFTVGQRRGLRVDRPSPDGRPRYVLSIEPVSRTVTVGPASGLDVTEITAERPVWSGCPAPEEPVECGVQLRAHGDAYPCTAWLADGTLRIRLHRPARAVASGQAAVLYDGDTVLGSATIASARAVLARYAAAAMVSLLLRNRVRTGTVGVATGPVANELLMMALPADTPPFPPRPGPATSTFGA